MRKRATGVVVREDKVLLVRDKGQKLYSLTGGGIDKRKDLAMSDPGNKYNNCRRCHAVAHTYGSLEVCKRHYRPSSKRAVVRELKEETGLIAHGAEFLFHFKSRHNLHSVYLIRDFTGELVARGEIDRAEFRDQIDENLLFRSARRILMKARLM